MKIIPLDRARCSHLDSLNRGIGTFTSFISNDSDFIFLEDHLNRLQKGAEYLFPNRQWMDKKKEIEDFLKTEYSPSHYFRLAIVEDALFFSKKIHEPKKAKIEVSEAQSLKSASLIPSYLKHPNYLLAELELVRARKDYFDDVLFFEERGKLAEASTSNVFVVLNNGTICTPPPSSTVLEGVIRKNLITFFTRENLKVIEKDIFKDEIQDASEMWLTNSIQGVRSVLRYEDQEFKKQSVYDFVCDKFGRFGERFFYE